MSLRRLDLVTLFALTIAIAAPTGVWAQNITVDFGSGACTLTGTSPAALTRPATELKHLTIRARRTQESLQLGRRGGRSVA